MLTNRGCCFTVRLTHSRKQTHNGQRVPTGSFRLEAALAGFKTALRSGIRISVTETTRLEVQLEVGGVSEIVNVEAAPVMVQQESSALGRVTTESVISNLPLVTRNFTQIL